MLSPFQQLRVNEESTTPIYKQIAEGLASFIQNGAVEPGERLPATRELAGQLGLNRATISAAYALLEETGLIEGHVGRGSFVARRPAATRDWRDWFAPAERSLIPTVPIEINFASSRPDQVAFPLDAFREAAREVLESQEAGDILQLGSPYGYPPLRRYLLDTAQEAGVAGGSDTLLVTNGCQQALDLLARTFTKSGIGIDVAIEDPAYHGLLRVMARTGVRLHPVPVGDAGIDLAALEETFMRHRPKLLVVTPSFHNPTGTTVPLAGRKRILELVAAHGAMLVENDIYSELRYRGEPLPSLKQLDPSGHTILLRSFSKVAFPGLRVGWVIGSREVVARLAEEKQIADLHSDQLSQAVLLRFAQSGRLGEHLQQTRVSGARRLEAALAACPRFLPPGSRWSRPDGGMSLWIQLPAPLLAEAVQERARKQGVDFLPGRTFAAVPGNEGGYHARALRISFGGLAPEVIRRGLEVVGRAAAEELSALRERLNAEPAMALV